jgi:hypothetical protein
VLAHLEELVLERSPRRVAEEERDHDPGEQRTDPPVVFAQRLTEAADDRQAHDLVRHETGF